MSNRDSTTYVSYSRSDSEFALRLADSLKSRGATVWLDQTDIEPERERYAAIEAALMTAVRVLVLLSPAAVRSTNVRNEIAFALDERKTIFPVLHQECEIPSSLRGILPIDLRADYETGVEALLLAMGVTTRQREEPVPLEMSELPVETLTEMDRRHRVERALREKEMLDAEEAAAVDEVVTLNRRVAFFVFVPLLLAAFIALTAYAWFHHAAVKNSGITNPAPATLQQK